MLVSGMLCDDRFLTRLVLSDDLGACRKVVPCTSSILQRKLDLADCATPNPAVGSAA